VTAIGPATVGLDVLRPGALLLRMRYSAYWTVDAPPTACLTRSPGGWIAIRARQVGALSLRLDLDGPAPDACTAAPAAPAAPAAG
jgi:hypothetical protein